jgi:tetratricopeptide (TPR) repeat protein
MSETHTLDHVVLDSENPWPGLHEFDERGKDFFNGRDQEISDLLRLVNDAPLTVLFGGSGLGKTSLLLAGLVPRLREQNKLSVYVRLDPRDRSAPLMEQAAAAFRAELAAHGVDHPPFPKDDSLWEYVHRSGFELWSKSNQLLTPVFIFDQFEEVFTLGRENAEAVRRLREDLADLVENRVPGPLARRFELATADAPPVEPQGRHFKLVFSFREDFLPEVEGWRSEIPSLVRNRFRLLPMNGQQALAAVTKTGGRLVDNTIGQAIVSFVAAAHAGLHRSAPHAAAATGTVSTGETDDLAQVTIEPALLSLVCTGLNERRKAAHKATIDQALLSGTGMEIVTEFYEGCVRDLPDRARRFIEDELITEGGFRNPYSREDAIAQGYLSDKQLEALVKRRLLRVERHLGTDRIELIHDLLTTAVRTFRDQERARSQRELAAEKDRKYRRRMLITATGGIAALIVLSILASVFWFLWRNAADALKAYETAEAGRHQAEERLSKETAQNEQMRALDEADKKRAHALTVASGKKYDEAIVLFSDSLSVYEKAGDASRMARALVNRGRIYALAEKHDLANQDLDQALDTARRMQSAADEALALESLAFLREQLGEQDAAVSLYEQALERYRTVGDSLSIARLWEWMAVREERLHNFERAVSNYQAALESFLTAGETIGATRVKEAILRTSSWGILVDLKRGYSFSMRGDRVTVGRDSPDFDIRNDINFNNRFVSRRHLVISHDEFRADDQRSTNGTTINAVQLPYGLGTKLSDGDIISLANKEVLQFRTQRETLPSVPPSTWAIFVDGSAKTYFYLTEPVYSIGLTSTGLRIEKGDTDSAPLKIRQHKQKPELFAASHEWTVVVVAKQNDYNYGQRPLPKRQWSELNDLPARLAKLSADGKKILEEGPAFQLVTITPD